MPRPRGENYEKNLKYRLKQLEKKIKLKENVLEQITNNNSTNEEKDNFRDFLIKNAVKNFFIKANNELNQFNEKKPQLIDEYNHFISQGIFYRDYQRPSYELLRKVSYTTSLIGAIIKIRLDQLMEYFHIPEHFTFCMVKKEKNIDEKTKELIKQAEELFYYMGENSMGENSEDNLFDVARMMINDILIIDTVSFYVIRNRLGKIIEIKYLDPATIFPVDPKKGYDKDKNVAYVQVVNGKVVETFTKNEIIYAHSNKLSDIKYRYTGLSPVEICINEIAGIISALRYNQERFSNNPPKGFLSIVGDVAEETLESLNLQWQSLWNNNRNNFEIPIISSEQEVKWTNLNISDDIAFEKLMQWLTTFILATFGMDQAELGLRLLGSQSLSEANMSDRIQNSSLRAKKSILTFCSNVFNKIKCLDKRFDSIKQVFINIDPINEEKELIKKEKLVKTIKTIDEIRAEMDLAPLGESIAEMYQIQEPEKKEKLKKVGAFILDNNFNQSAGKYIQKLLFEEEINKEKENIKQNNNQDTLDFEDFF